MDAYTSEGHETTPSSRRRQMTTTSQLRPKARRQAIRPSTAMRRVRDPNPSNEAKITTSRSRPKEKYSNALKSASSQYSSHKCSMPVDNVHSPFSFPCLLYIQFSCTTVSAQRLTSNISIRHCQKMNIYKLISVLNKKRIVHSFFN